MALHIDVLDFVKQIRQLPVVDVRTASEYRRGHIPHALNFPLFSDEERAEVGLVYKQMGRSRATQTGLEIVGPRLSDMIDRFRNRFSPGGVLVHCWRGGMRSESVAWLVGLSGEFKPSVLRGGYKAYRNFALREFSAERRLVILGGMTGVGKTTILNGLSASGLQRVDLEKLAAHKGSAFGAIGEPEAPTQQQFENELAYELHQTDPDRVLWLEDESRHIGKRIIPQDLWALMRNAPVIAVERSREERVRHLVEQYGTAPEDELIASIRKIERRLGGARTKAASEAVLSGDLDKACNLVLDYYDRAYAHGLSKRDPATIKRLDATGLSDADVVEKLIDSLRQITGDL